MRLLEYQAKTLIARKGVPIPRGRVALSAVEAKQIADELGGRAVVKAQVAVTGRGKAGGIRVARSPEETQKLTTLILGMDIKGFLVRKVLIDEAITIASEIYLGVAVDRSAYRSVLIASAAGGADIEDVAQQTPEKVFKVNIDPFLGLLDFQIRDIAASIDLPHQYWHQFSDVARGLWSAYTESDATLAEINPLVITEDGRLLALDAKMTLDENALFRHPDLAEMRDNDVESLAEVEARMHGLSYIKLDGEIGCLVNGAGLAMATMDLIKLCGGEAANFLDIGGGASAEKVEVALRIIMTDNNVRAILINVFGGITRCDEVARGILAFQNETNTHLPIVVRLVGTNAEEGFKLLEGAKVITNDTMLEAAQTVISLAKAGTNEHSGR